MPSNRFTLAALAIACILAAAGGGYLASRQTAVPATSAAQTASVPAASPAPSPLQKTAVGNGDTDSKATPTSVAAPPSSVATAAGRRAESDARRSAPTPTLETNPTANVKNTESTPPALDRQAPSPASSAPSTQSTAAPSVAPGPPALDASAPAPRSDDRIGPDGPRPEPQKAFEELVVAADSVIGLQAETSVSSDRARVEDRVEARVARDVRVRDTIAIPAGARAIGSVTQVDRGGKFKERARIGIRFHTLVLADDTRVPITTETIYRDGEAPGNESAKRIGGGAIAGTIIGAIIGGGKGAAIGATAGAAAGTGSVMAGDRNAATLRSGEPITVRILAPVTVTLEK